MQRPDDAPDAGTLALIDAAIAGGYAVVCRYTDATGETTARVFVPRTILTTMGGHTVVRCHDTHANEIRSLRLDRITAPYRLTLPPGTTTEPPMNLRPARPMRGA